MNIFPYNNIQILKDNFSMCFDKCGAFDIDKFKEILSKNEVCFSRESYGMDWLGKGYARLRATDALQTVIQEDVEWNKDKNTENILIRGDNLEALKHLSNAYNNKIKMIYIDPPYNTGNDGFVYNDKKKYNKEDLIKLTGMDEDKAKRVLSFLDKKSNSHSAWMTFMYPRLYTARQLLKNDGVIFISIDDNEATQLKILMDMIFGETNFVGQIIWNSNLKGRQISKNDISRTKEYILCYAKNKDNICNMEIKVDDAKRIMPSAYKGFDYDTEEDENGSYVIKNKLYNTNSNFNEQTRPNLVYDIYYNPADESVSFSYVKDYYKISAPYIKGTTSRYAWRWSKDKVIKDIKDLLFIKNKSGEYDIYTKVRDYQSTNLKDIITNVDGSASAREIQMLFGEKVFEHAKPLSLINILISVSTSADDIILDFFAGSGTTGDAVMRLNKQDGGNRRYILIQLPEVIDDKKNNIAYNFIKNTLGIDTPKVSDITKERLIRAADMIGDTSSFKCFDVIDTRAEIA